jgi:hypothetical protein
MIGHEINERSEGQERENLRAKGQKDGRHAKKGKYVVYFDRWV